MSFRAKSELLVQVAPRCRAARRGQRSGILDEFVAVTGYERKYAIRLLLGPIDVYAEHPHRAAVQVTRARRERSSPAWTRMAPQPSATAARAEMSSSVMRFDHLT